MNHVVPHEELLPFARKLAADIATDRSHAPCGQMLPTYDDGALRDGAGAWDLEAEVAAWQGGGLDPAAIEQSRQAVIARGRTQL